MALAAVESLHRQLRLFGITLAYNDFGAGQARLELTAIPPRYLKFDIALVRDLDRAPEQRRRMVGLLVHFARETGVTTLAEGITRAGEAEACAELGFDWGEGITSRAPNHSVGPAPASTCGRNPAYRCHLARIGAPLEHGRPIPGRCHLTAWDSASASSAIPGRRPAPAKRRRRPAAETGLPLPSRQHRGSPRASQARSGRPCPTSPAWGSPSAS
ncbi:MAG: EAL domain-containing protein [Halofilum sp. (in: g-proteobacteria)]|nr:EAL domain-containing protein [Halofilum sp. (in: g-proteobacteria)]